MAGQITWEQALAVRMHRHTLEERGSREDLIPLARTLCGFHGQVFSSAELTAAVRLDGLNPGDLESALWYERSLYKTWAMRGTLHILASDQFPMWIAAMSHLPRADDSASWRRYFETDTNQVDAMLAAIDVTLRRGVHSREDLAHAVADRSGDPGLADKLISGWGPFLKPAARLGSVCFAPNDGRMVQFIHPVTWLGDLEAIDSEEARRAALRQYLHTYGPARRQDLMHWFGIQKASVGTAFMEAIADETTEIAIDGETRPYTILTDDLEFFTSATPSTTVRLLPAFDQYIVNATRKIEAIVPAKHTKAVSRPQGWISATIVRGGAVIGTWAHDLTPKALAVSLSPFASTSKAVTRAIEDEAERLAGFYGRPLTVQWDV